MATEPIQTANDDRRLNFGFAQRSETWLAASVLVGLALTIVPLPTVLLDMCLALNLAAAILLLLVTLNAKRSLDLAVFPSVLLLLTLFRLSLNVATTRLILLDGNAGKIVNTFGDLVVGGNPVVGIVIFLILVTIQFIVITKGATRISEVNARFTLDALPGKQMAIDAEMNAGAISEEQARVKRRELVAEAEFYGAMDGASKYVRGDSIAGLIIMAVNIIGGVVIALTQGQTIGDAFRIYSILTIGDGLVSQIPALIIATSAGMLVTKSSSGDGLGDEIESQLSRGSAAMMTGGVILLMLGLIPDMPKFPFFFLSAVLFALYFRNKRLEQEPETEETEDTSEEAEMSPCRTEPAPVFTKRSNHC